MKQMERYESTFVGSNSALVDRKGGRMRAQ